MANTAVNYQTRDCRVKSSFSLLPGVSITTISVVTSLLTYNDMNLLDQCKFTMHRQATYIWPSLHFLDMIGKTTVTTWHPSQKFRFRRNYLLFSSVTRAHSLTSLYGISNFRCDVSELRIKYIPHVLIVWFPKIAWDNGTKCMINRIKNDR